MASRDWPDARVETPATAPSPLPPTISRQCGSRIVGPKVTGAPQGHQLFARAPIHLDTLANSLAATNFLQIQHHPLTLFFFFSPQPYLRASLVFFFLVFHCNQKDRFSRAFPLAKFGIYN